MMHAGKMCGEWFEYCSAVGTLRHTMIRRILSFTALEGFKRHPEQSVADYSPGSDACAFEA
jgi:hypothetical protein